MVNKKIFYNCIKIFLLLAITIVNHYFNKPLFASFSDKSIKIIIPEQANSDELKLNSKIDLLQFITKILSKELNNKIQIIFYPQANGIIGVNQVVNSEPDGTIFGFFPLNLTINQPIYGGTPYTSRELTPIIAIYEDPYILVSKKEAPFNDLASLSQLAKQRQIVIAKQSKKFYSSEDINILNIAKELDFKWQTRLFNIINTELLFNSGIDVVPIKLSQFKNDNNYDKIKVIAVLSDTYTKGCAPENLSLNQQGISNVLNNWESFYLSSNTDINIIEGLSLTLNKVLKESDIKGKIESYCFTPKIISYPEVYEDYQKSYKYHVDMIKLLNLL